MLTEEQVRDIEQATKDKIGDGWRLFPLPPHTAQLCSEWRAFQSFYTARQLLERSLTVAARCRRGGASVERQTIADQAVAASMRLVDMATARCAALDEEVGDELHRDQTVGQ